MDLAKLKNMVLARLNEVEHFVNSDTVKAYNIDEFLLSATENLLRVAPSNMVPVTDATGIKANAATDGSGTVLLPNGFIRLIAFRMKGWERPVTSLIMPDSATHKQQFNPFTRGAAAKPVVVLHKGHLEYFSLPAGAEHIVEVFRYVKLCKPEELPNELTSSLSWLTASLCLGVNSEAEAAEFARKQYESSILSQYGTAGN